MRTSNIFAAVALAGAGFIGTTLASSAATVDFTGAPNGIQSPYVEDGLSFDTIRIVSGKCDALSGKDCGALNDNETSVLTKVGGGTFSLTSFWYQLLGKGTGGPNGVTNTLTVMSDLGGILTFAADLVGFNDGGHVVDLTMFDLFQDVTSLTFSTADGGNVRIDDLAIYSPPPAAVPLPAAGFMLLGAMGGMAALRRRKTA